MFDQIFDRILYFLMAAVLIVPEPTTFLVCLLMLAGIVAHCGSQIMAMLRIGEPATAVESMEPSEELLVA